MAQGDLQNGRVLLQCSSNVIAPPEGRKLLLRVRFWKVYAFSRRRETQTLQMFLNGHKNPVAPASGFFTNS
jgi:hypothetical protein